jgi:hypothetical protein
MRKGSALLVLVAAALAAAVAAFAGNGTPINTGSANVLTLAVYGDSPYSTTGDADPNATTQEFLATPAFIDAINHDPKVDLVVHVGDIHSGSQRCTQPYDQSIFDLWTAYKDPLIYTPGDNEWSDCQKAKQLGPPGDQDPSKSYANADPIANLALVRSIFFAHPGYTLGGRPKQVISQAQVGTGTDAEYVENVMWEQSKTLFVTINVPGGSNNDNDDWFGHPRTQAQTDEINNRTQADIDWLNAAFGQAKADGVGAVVIITQADMWDVTDMKAGHQAAYEPIIANMVSNTLSFVKPVLFFNGDAHVYRSDDPLEQGSACTGDFDASLGANTCSIDAWTHHEGPAANHYDVPNFHRVTVHGSTFPLEYLRLTVDPRASNPTTSTSFGPFSWERVQP